ncbi:MAG: hypothetical protein OXC07_08580 [Kistimonas sp.]|nr:hypothetical protein [Kistimonas sp.]
MHCIRLGAKPWHFFRINACYFNSNKGIFSKLDLNQRIPAHWRLEQYRDTGTEKPARFPVFVKPEWGQNSVGVCCAHSQQQLDRIRAARSPEKRIGWLIQEAAAGKREFEVFLVSETQPGAWAVLSVTETINAENNRFPVNGIHNGNTRYRDITWEMSAEQLDSLWHHLSTMDPFRVARFGIRADSLTDLSEGRFQIFEINLFTPMPLTLLAENVSLPQKLRSMNRITTAFARLTGALEPRDKDTSIFFRKVLAHRENKAATVASTPRPKHGKTVLHKGASL